MRKQDAWNILSDYFDVYDYDLLEMDDNDTSEYEAVSLSSNNAIIDGADEEVLLAWEQLGYLCWIKAR